MKKALFLSGGGARGAYQAGVLRGICDILNCKETPIDIISSLSAGAINASFLAARIDNFKIATSELSDVWLNIKCEKIFKANNISLIRSVLRNVMSMIFHLQLEGGQYLLDTSPLRALLTKNIDFNKIHSNIHNGHLTAFEMATTCYDLSRTISFYCASSKTNWERSRHIGRKVKLKCEHVLASSAVPLFFPAIKLGKLHYGDGGLRHSAPLRSAINFGADSILVIGTRQVAKATTLLRSRVIKSGISYANILGNMLDAVFLDNLDKDLELLERINTHVDFVSRWSRRKFQWRNIKILYIQPSVDLGIIAQDTERNLPFLLEYLMTSFGAKEQAGEFLSFMLFESAFTQKLIEIGYQDAINQADEIKAFFEV